MEHFESKITSVKVHNKTICYHINNKKERKRLFGLISSLPAGYYTDSGRYLGNEEDLLNGSYTVYDFANKVETKIILVCEDKIAYYRPYVKILFDSGDVKYKYFNTIGECDFYAKNLQRSWSHIILIDVNKL